MQRNFRRILIYPILLLFLSTGLALGQQKMLIDQIVATVGDKKILQSDVENQILQLQAQGYASPTVRCDVLTDLISQKLLLIQAEKDSVTVSPSQVEGELERRLQYFVRQIGSQEKLEEYYNKSIPEIKQDLREMLHDQIRTQKMKQQLMMEVDISPQDVKSFYKNMNEDSIPMINKKVKINQIVKYPEESDKAESSARKELLELRKRILEGERFSTMAVLYSDDPGTARKGGELGFRSEEELDPAFADAAYGLQEGEVSGIVESAYGFHLIKLIAREGDQVNVRHILKRPNVTFQQKQQMKANLDSIAELIRTGEYTFEKAAIKFSEDKKYKQSGGLLVNPMDASNEFELDQLPSADYTAVKDLKVGEISDPFEGRDENGNIVFKIIKLKSEIPAHRANLEEDFDRIKQIAKQTKQQEIISRWLDKKQKNTYIHVDPSFDECDIRLGSRQ